MTLDTVKITNSRPDGAVTISFRIYADGTIVSEDDFSEYDNSTPYYDDYAEHTMPYELYVAIAGGDA